MGGRQTAPWGVGQLGAGGHFGGAPNPISAQSALGGPRGGEENPSNLYSRGLNLRAPSRAALPLHGSSPYKPDEK